MVGSDQYSGRTIAAEFIQICSDLGRVLRPRPSKVREKQRTMPGLPAGRLKTPVLHANLRHTCGTSSERFAATNLVGGRKEPAGCRR